MKHYWFWHLLYDNRLFGRWLWRAVRRFQWHRQLEGDWGIEYGIYGFNYQWQQRQRNRIVFEDGQYQLKSPRSRI